jgi:hypothetical protein
MSSRYLVRRISGRIKGALPLVLPWPFMSKIGGIWVFK